MRFPSGQLIILATLAIHSLAAPAAPDPPPWALQPITTPPVPESTLATTWAKNPIDHFIAAKLQAHHLTPSQPATPRSLVRRLHFDLHGLPPTSTDIARFNATGPSSYITDLLADPAYGERWARHWMDTVHYAETHGHDEDAIRTNAWPYRDYLITSLNQDKPYARFVREQVAGDVLYPDDPQATVATAFLALGPWDSSSQMGIQDGTTDKKIAQLLDRDDMLTTTMSTFASTTVHCARCHDHKFDPVPASDYYALQAVFAGVDRADRPYDPDPQRHQQRHQLTSQLDNLTPGNTGSITRTAPYKTWLATTADTTGHWTTLTPESVTSTGGSTTTINPDGSVTLGGTPRPEKDTTTISTHSPLATITAIRLEVLTDPSLPHNGPGRQDNGNLHLSEITIGTDGHPVPVASASADFDQASWTIQHAIDGNPTTAWGIYPEVGAPHTAIFTLEEPLHIAPDSTLTVQLDQLHGGGHLIGRPRLSATSSPSPQLAKPLPKSILTALAPPRDHHTLARF
ncbi:MAG: DUF1549 domain-containing protein, partial [Verrucomicrobiales bacterium]|nr:DUF1549 domain-containing protein [Verrucomicrobiales bacterium]